MGRRQQIVAFGTTLVVVAAVWAKGGPADSTGPADGDKTSSPSRAARRAGASPIDQAPGPQSGESKLADALRTLRQARVNAQGATARSGSAPTIQPTGKPAGAAAKRPTSRPTVKATTRPAAAAPASDDRAGASPTLHSYGDGATERALETLRAIDDKDIPDPLALGDALYLAGRTRGAVIFYAKALAQKGDRYLISSHPSSDNPGLTEGNKVSVPLLSEADRAWILYQLGNCHRVSDPAVAAGYYKRVVSEHGRSDWAIPSKVQADLIQWRLQNRPAELIKTAIAGAKAP